MRTTHAVFALVTTILIGAHAIAERRWLTGTWTQVGINRSLFVADVAHEQLPPGRNLPQKTEVARYVIETEDRRYELQAMVAIGADEFDALVTIGKPVTFAIEKNTAYIKVDDKKGEHRLLVLKNERKKTP